MMLRIWDVLERHSTSRFWSFPKLPVRQFLKILKGILASLRIGHSKVALQEVRSNYFEICLAWTTFGLVCRRDSIQRILFRHQYREPTGAPCPAKPLIGIYSSFSAASTRPSASQYRRRRQQGHLQTPHCTDCSGEPQCSIVNFDDPAALQIWSSADSRSSCSSSVSRACLETDVRQAQTVPVP
jgi:hypothetical protein